MLKEKGHLIVLRSALKVLSLLKGASTPMNNGAVDTRKMNTSNPQHLFWMFLTTFMQLKMYLFVGTHLLIFYTIVLSYDKIFRVCQKSRINEAR